MFPLSTSSFPASAAELEAALLGGLQGLFDGPIAANVTGIAYPDLDAIDVNISGAELKTGLTRPAPKSLTGEKALRARRLQITGTPLLVGPARINLRVTGSDVRIDRAPDRSGAIVLLLGSAADGSVEIDVRKTEIESAIARVGNEQAKAHGVSIDQVELQTESRGARVVAAEVRLRAKKLFFTAVIRIAAQLEISEALDAKISGLKCTGDGTVGSLACGVLAPHLQKLDGRSLSLLALPLGEIRLRDVRFETGEILRVCAEFGA